MSQTEQLVDALKRLLKARGVTYNQVAAHLGLSEPSVKRQLARRRLQLHTLEAIATCWRSIWPSWYAPPTQRSRGCIS